MAGKTQFKIIAKQVPCLNLDIRIGYVEGVRARTKLCFKNEADFENMIEA